MLGASETTRVGALARNIFAAEIVDEGARSNIRHEGHAGENALLSTCHHPPHRLVQTNDHSTPRQQSLRKAVAATAQRLA